MKRRQLQEAQTRHPPDEVVMDRHQITLLQKSKEPTSRFTLINQSNRQNVKLSDILEQKKRQHVTSQKVLDGNREDTRHGG